MQACFLEDVRVIWCSSLGDSHFQTNVIDDVKNLFNYYLHITFYVSHTLTSCTHHTQSLLNLVHMIVCWLVWPSLIAYELMCKCKLLFWLGIWRKMCFRSLNLCFNFLIGLILAFKRHHVFKTFLDHVHLHWVIKIAFKLFLYIKFPDF